MEKITDDTKIQFRAEKICVKRPTRGAILDIAIYLELVTGLLETGKTEEGGVQGTRT
jgi:hypothetical protein